MPPAWAMAMASRLSVTVSIAAETSGMFSAISRVSRVAMLTCARHDLEWPGRSKTSSNASPMGKPLLAFAIACRPLPGCGAPAA